LLPQPWVEEPLLGLETQPLAQLELWLRLLAWPEPVAWWLVPREASLRPEVMPLLLLQALRPRVPPPPWQLWLLGLLGLLAQFSRCWCGCASRWCGSPCVVLPLQQQPAP